MKNGFALTRSREREEGKSETREMNRLKETAVASYNLIRSGHDQKRGNTKRPSRALI
jgi:hypothetical protein